MASKITNIKLAYQPIREITQESYDNYMIWSNFPGFAKALAVKPFEEALKDDKREEFNFEDFKVGKKQGNPSTSWKKVYDAMTEFLSIRADDSRASKFPDLKFFEGVGYCIAIPALSSWINNRVKDETCVSDSVTLSWPQKKKDEEPVRKLVLQYMDYSKISTENAVNVLRAKRFCTGLEGEVGSEFKDLNQQWFSRETGYSKDNIPPREESPVKVIREVGDGRYVFMNLVREETPVYKEIIPTLLAEIQDLESGVVIEGYKTKRTGNEVFVNIKNVCDRLSLERLAKDEFIKVGARYEIIP